jgi:hypothetical protein
MTAVTANVIPNSPNHLSDQSTRVGGWIDDVNAASWIEFYAAAHFVVLGIEKKTPAR